MISDCTQDFNDVIALKLKKPKTWNWKLFTSKSSPHISLPVIKLYDYKGNLLVQTNEDGSLRRSQIFQGDQHYQQKKHVQNSEKSECKAFHSKRTYCDKGDVVTSNRQEKSISVPEKRRSDKNNNDFVKSSVGKIEVTEKKTPEHLSKRSQVERKNLNNKGEENRCPLNTKEQLMTGNCVRKSKTDILYIPADPTTNGPQHRRTRSDDAFKRKLKYNDDDRPKYPGADIRISKSFSQQDILEHACKSSEKYKTRTSSAGTLIISEESFNKTNRRKRPERVNTSVDVTSTKTSKQRCQQIEKDLPLVEDISNERRRSSVISATPISYDIYFPTTDDGNQSETVISHVRQRSDPLRYSNICEEQTSDMIGKLRDEYLEKKENGRSLLKQVSSKRSEAKNVEKAHSTLSCSPLQPEQHHRKKKRKRMRRHRRHSDGSTSSNTDNAEWKNRNGRETSAAKETKINFEVLIQLRSKTLFFTMNGFQCTK
ncbi:hypothetical protein WA026_007326 [Henosepilachna vigintioctopunctata]|uniref:Uncharacterized protein n=1 Tax=Henosepilachna vigintioctopunctata TaxID=420089 RepID=A0AAW1UUG6_9CUCU